jgi:hypothetical protein
MIVPGSVNPLLLATGGYDVPYSLRFRAANSAYLSRTSGASPTSKRTFTYSAWIKAAPSLSSATQIALVSSSANNGMIGWNIVSFGGRLFIRNDAANDIQFSGLFRDPSAWGHLVVAIDTTQATSSDRVKVYWNGVAMTYLSGTYPSLNYDSYLNAALTAYRIMSDTVNGTYVDGYLAEMNFIDGQALTPSSFGQTDSATGVWVPKKYSGTYGNNGFYLKFADASAATAAAIGKDSSGNGNNWTPSGISVTSGVTFDQMLDTPTLNYAVFDALSPVGSASSIGTLSAANMTFDHSAANYAQRFGSFAVNSGKWYFEYTITTFSSNKGCAFGIGKTESYPSGTGVPSSWTGCVAYGDFGDSYLRPITESSGLVNTSGVASMTFAVNDVIMIAFDVGAGKFWMGKNGTWFDSGNPAGGTNEKQTITANINWRPWCLQYGSSAAQSVVNYGQRAFSYTPPTGFKALNTANLPTPSIKKGSLYMDATLRTGTGATASVSSLGFQPDLVWIKGRSGATDHGIYDAVRGVQKQIESNTTTAETTETTGLTAFNSNGYTVGSLAQLNTSAATYVDWAWKEGVTPGFDIVTYVGNGTNRTISHNLGAVPHFIIVKNRTTSPRAWTVYHRNANASPASGALYLNLTDAFAADSTNWNNTLPTSNVFSVGTADRVNQNTDNLVAYLWSEIEGFSKISSYTGNGSTDGPFVWCGHRPRYILIKSTGAENWSVQDSARNPYNVVDARLKPNSADAEGVGSAQNVDFLSNGFKLRTTDPEKNGSGTTYIFAAFAENPFKYARAR